MHLPETEEAEQQDLPDSCLLGALPVYTENTQSHSSERKILLPWQKIFAHVQSFWNAHVKPLD